MLCSKHCWLVFVYQLAIVRHVRSFDFVPFAAVIVWNHDNILITFLYCPQLLAMFCQAGSRTNNSSAKCKNIFVMSRRTKCCSCASIIPTGHRRGGHGASEHGSLDRERPTCSPAAKWVSSIKHTYSTYRPRSFDEKTSRNTVPANLL